MTKPKPLCLLVIWSINITASSTGPKKEKYFKWYKFWRTFSCLKLNSKFSWSSVSQRVKLFSLSSRLEANFGIELKTILLTKLVEIFLDFFWGSLLADSTNKNLPRLGFFALALWSCWLWIDLLTIKNMWLDSQYTLDWTWRGEGDETKASTSLNKAYN